MVCASIPFFLTLRKIQYLIYEAIDVTKETADDYALFVENIQPININQ